MFWFFSLLVIHMRNTRKLPPRFSWRASGKIGKVYHGFSSSLSENRIGFQENSFFSQAFVRQLV